MISTPESINGAGDYLIRKGRSVIEINCLVIKGLLQLLNFKMKEKKNART